MAGQAHALDRRWATDPRATVAALTLVLVAAAALGNVALVALAIGGLAGFSLSGSP